MRFHLFRKTRAFVKQRPVCADCGGRDVEAHGMLSWDDKHQDWQLAEAWGYGSCPDCGNTEVNIKWENY